MQVGALLNSGAMVDLTRWQRQILYRTNKQQHCAQANLLSLPKLLNKLVTKRYNGGLRVRFHCGKEVEFFTSYVFA